MQPGRWQQIEQLYFAALERQAGDRTRFLEQSCAGDTALRREVESLLAVAADADGYLQAAVRGGLAAAAAPALAPGRLGRYQLVEQVGKGGMGLVYRAVDPVIGRTVAIKTILCDDPTGSANPELRARLLRESQAAGQLSHPNIVAIYDVSEEGGTAYIVMEFVVGLTLDRAVASYPSLRTGAFALGVIEQCAAALDYAHSRGVVHRDIKPANLMLQSDGLVKIADFGIARAASMAPLTRSTAILGSPQYMAPEQWKGEAVSAQTDQYALAVVAYALLTGRLPFDGDQMATLAARTLYEEPPAATACCPALNQGVDGVFRRALAKNAAERYETCGQFAAALRSACGGSAQAEGPATPRRRRSTTLLAVAAILTVALATASVGGFWLYRHRAVAPQQSPVSRPVVQTSPPSTTTTPVQAVKPPPTRPVKQEQQQHQQQPPPPRKPEPPAADLYAQGEAFLKSGAWEQAVPWFTRAIAQRPDYASYFGRAGAYQHLERLELAIEDYTQALRRNPTSAMAYHERAICLAKLKRDDLAFADFNRAIELAPDYPLSWNGRGVIYLHRGEFQRAIADFTQAIQLRPGMAQAYKNRAAAKKAIGDAAGASADLAVAQESR